MKNMLHLLMILAFVSTAAGFDLSAVDTGNANWLPTDINVADVTIHLKSEVEGLFKRDEIFPFRYAGPKISKTPSGKRLSQSFGGNRTYVPFDASGNKGWIYIKEISDQGVHVRCVVREPKDDGKILYEKEFLIPWTAKRFLLDTNTEHFDAEIEINSNT